MLGTLSAGMMGIFMKKKQKQQE
ncbi:MAG: hypothetical protein GW795_00235 [Cyanobacteria bacterium]|nr:hypothetical protein [Cyanobacteria bacterium CG_2015-16_32_12]NCO78794.1 hypothetical protein [Cyanobacteria bacterium CG_2015-22_32_23]NCQ03489.1 hypothetical protein [Cyanobacteria bacterium CG_2015-09_32_10]NCQ40346.1 hypothetical protein [Cyanobacteria bacterium CG_2015-04_32_10]NCS86101.1 hypothetical protein [Cyanobacteria bacterium CG_2015-02_32_10]